MLPENNYGAVRFTFMPDINIALQYHLASLMKTGEYEYTATFTVTVKITKNPTDHWIKNPTIIVIQ